MARLTALTEWIVLPKPMRLAEQEIPNFAPTA
jgi:hypothetical protein